jgi:hypothetical protein
MMQMRLSVWGGLVCACCVLVGAGVERAWGEAENAEQAKEGALGALYRAHIDAFNRKDARAFFGMYAPSVCFHNDKVTPADLEATYAKHFSGAGEPVEVKYIHVLLESATEARLWVVYTHGKRPVTRVLALTKGDTGWQITTETNPTRLKCAPDLLKGLPDDMSAIITATAKQIQALGEVLDGKEMVENLSWEGLYCPKGYAVDVDGWSDHDIGKDGELEFYCMVSEVTCRHETDREKYIFDDPAVTYYQEVNYHPQCDGDAGQFQDAWLSLKMRGEDVFTVGVERPYPLSP